MRQATGRNQYLRDMPVIKRWIRNLAPADPEKSSPGSSIMSPGNTGKHHPAR